MFYVEVVNQYLAVPQVSGELAQKVMNEALKYQGWKYVYGGSNPNTSFDCSEMCIRDRLMRTDWEHFSLLENGLTLSPYNFITIGIATGVCALVAFLYYRFCYDLSLIHI